MESLLLHELICGTSPARVFVDPWSGSPAGELLLGVANAGNDVLLFAAPLPVLFSRVATLAWAVPLRHGCLDSHRQLPE